MIYILIFILSVLNSNQPTADQNELVVNILEIPSTKGQLVVRLHNSADNFPISVYKEKILSIPNKQIKIVYSNLPSGEYAVTVIHDKNKNGKLDFNFLHIPTEKTCVSNDAKGFIGPPKFKNAKFELEKDIEIKIRF